MAIEYHFTIPIQPVTKKNSQEVVPCGRNPRTGKTRYKPIPSAAYRKYEAAARYLLPRMSTINQPVEITGLFYMGDRRKRDLVNLLEALDDVLVKWRIIEDDNFHIIVSHDGSRVLYDKEHPRTEVTIRLLDPEPGQDKPKNPQKPRAGRKKPLTRNQLK